MLKIRKGNGFQIMSPKRLICGDIREPSLPTDVQNKNAKFLSFMWYNWFVNIYNVLNEADIISLPKKVEAPW